MADNREAILARLLTIAQGIPGVHEMGVSRNSEKAPESWRPSIIIYDNDEQADDRAFERNRPAWAKNLVGMTPEVLLSVSSSPANVGNDLNTLRGLFVKAVLTDSTLQSLCHNGEMQYRGCVTSLNRERELNGEMAIYFQFTYVFDPSKL